MKKILHNPIWNGYMCKLIIRLAIFIFIFVYYIKDSDGLALLMTKPIWKGIGSLHVVWAVFMIMMIRHIFYPKKFTMALRKTKEAEYVEKPNYNKLELYEYVHDQNVRAWRVMLVWLCFNAIWGILYLLKILDDADLLMLTLFYFLSDYVCILFFCPYQTFFMKSKCCVSCRIYDWGHFMMFTPMLFIKNFFSWSLFFTSCVVLIHWEISYAKHPERFWSGSNQHLDCSNCKDQICQVKKKLKIISH